MKRDVINAAVSHAAHSSYNGVNILRKKAAFVFQQAAFSMLEPWLSRTVKAADRVHPGHPDVPTASRCNVGRCLELGLDLSSEECPVLADQNV